MQASNPTSSRLCENDREFHTHTALHSKCARPNYNQHTQRKVIDSQSDNADRTTKKQLIKLVERAPKGAGGHILWTVLGH
jgi:hypothetical protein